MNYREAWANGEIEAGTLVDRIEEQAREIERLTHKNDRQGESIKRYQDEGQGSLLELDILRSELTALKTQQSGVVLPERKQESPSWGYDMGGNYDEGHADGWNQALDEVARLNQPASAGDIFVVGYHCRDSKGIATINWLPHENAVPLMTVAQHQRILASATKQAGEVAYDVFVSRELLDLLADAEKNERHRNLKETRYWCDQYRQIARAALSANHSEQVRVVLPKPLKRGDAEAERGEYGGAMARGYSAYERQLIRLNPGLAFAAAPSAGSQGGDV